MKIAIMQPYFFPYIGYFQLLNETDCFVVLDDVNFIKRGWIHRNRIWVNGKDWMFSIPLKKASQNRMINEIEISDAEFVRFHDNLVKSISLSYGRQKFFREGLSLVEESLKGVMILDVALKSLRLTCEALQIKTPIILSSSLGGKLSRERRLVEICHELGADTYINLPGGMKLYTSSMFDPYGITLKFIQPRLTPFPVHDRPCQCGLSILDPLMCCGASYIRENLINTYTILEAA